MKETEYLCVNKKEGWQYNVVARSRGDEYG